ncbi:dTDP-4-dehydrorhamnose reductase [Weeksellaceae bacterium TAE3-ERU29]|nr:dTDP-4-dehydrorhamnose reductase [Weeksellaceae bacterium TAE3-ERU29]
MKQVLVIGANGQLGNCIKKAEKKYNLPETQFTYVDRTELDITNASAIENYLNNNSFDYVVNCAAYTAVDQAETDKETAFKVNADAAGYLAKETALRETTFIHISTDYVFDGTADIPIKPNDKTNPINAYGESKLKGEQLALTENPKTIIIRTAWVYSEFGGNFVKTMLRLFSEKEEISVVNDQKGTPTNANDLAEAIINIIKNGLKESGIYHFTNEGETTWFDFANTIKEITHSSIIIKPTSSVNYKTPAKRPNYSVLDLSKFKETFKQEIPEWKISLKIFLKEFDLAGDIKITVSD